MSSVLIIDICLPAHLQRNFRIWVIDEFSRVLFFTVCNFTFQFQPITLFVFFAVFNTVCLSVRVIARCVAKTMGGKSNNEGSDTRPGIFRSFDFP